MSTRKSLGPVSVIGTGAMGSAITRTLLAAGHAVTVWNRTAARTRDLADAGATVASTAAEAASAGPLILIAVLDQAAVRDVRSAIERDVSGRVIVNLTSGSPAQARETARWAAEHGAEYLDGSIIADPQIIGSPRATLLYSGTEAAYSAHEDTLTKLGGATSYFGSEPGRAAAYFLGLIGFGYETWAAFLRVLAQIEAEHGDPARFAPLAVDSMVASADLLRAFARSVAGSTHPPLAGPLQVHAALMDDLIDGRESVGVEAEPLRRVKELVDRSVHDGHGADGFSRVIDQLRSRQV